MNLIKLKLPVTVSGFSVEQVGYQDPPLHGHASTHKRQHAAVTAG